MKFIFSTLLLFVCFVACKKDAAIDQPGQVAHVMFYNGSIEFYNSNSLLLVNNKDSQQLTYNGISNTPLGAFNYAHYQKMVPGNYVVSFTDTAAKPVKLTNDVYNVKGAHYQTIYLTDSAGYYQTISSNDDVARDDDSASIRFIHLSPDAGPVTLYIDSMRVDNTKDIRFKQLSTFIKVKPDIKPGIRIRYMQGSDTLTLIRKSFALEAGKCYTLVLRGAIHPPDDNVNKNVNLSGIINQ
jgi:hypothetical protein